MILLPRTQLRRTPFPSYKQEKNFQEQPLPPKEQKEKNTNAPFSFKGQTVILIGSADDINGRKMGKNIDAGKYGTVVRVNKPYGSKEDRGERADYIFVGREKWLKDEWKWKYWEVPTVCYYEGKHVNKRFHNDVKRDWKITMNASTGIKTLYYILKYGAEKVYIIGFGYMDGVFNVQKTYADGTKDTNPHHKWEEENNALLRLQESGKVILL